MTRATTLLSTIVGVAAAATSCARPASQAPEVQGPQPIILTSERGIMLGERPRSQALVVKTTPVTAWRTAKRVYEALMIPVTLEDPAAHQIGNKDFRKTGSVGPLRMAEVVDCGMGITGRKADFYRIYMSLVTTVSADASGGTLLQTTLIAYGQDVSGGNADRIQCGTTGVLESVVNESIRDNAMK